MVVSQVFTAPVPDMLLTGRGTLLEALPGGDSRASWRCWGDPGRPVRENPSAAVA